MNEETRTRANMLASFYAACRMTRNGGLVLNGASAAGMLLHATASVSAALELVAMMPQEGPWPIAAVYLAELDLAESADTQPPTNLRVAR